MVELLNGVCVQSLGVGLSVCQRQFQVHHFSVGLSQLEHQLSADHEVVLGVQVFTNTHGQSDAG